MADTSKEVNGIDAKDLHSLLSSPARDFLVRNDGEQVKIDSLIGKKIGLYFSAAWCGPCQRFTPQLVEVYNELSSKVGFEIVFVSGDEDEESFGDYFSKMPWLAVPFTDSETRDRLDELFKVRGIPNLVMVDDHGKLVNENGVGVIRSYGADAYPFTPEKMKEIKEEEDRARREQTLRSVLVTPSRDFVISPDGNKVPVSELEGKTIGLLFSVASYRKCTEFTPKLVEFYTKLKENKEDFEIVLISLEDDEESFNQEFKTKPWLSLPFNDKSASKLARHFMLATLPTLVILGPDGKTRHSNVAEAIDDYGVLAYPFTPEKFEELKEIEKAKLEAQTLESLLVSGDLNYVLGKDGAKVLISDLVGKNILIYFSAHWCPPCRAFTPKLVEVYKQIKERDEAFELIFISSDRDQESFDEYYSQMPWLALPFGDPRKTSLARTFKVGGIPMLAALGPTGKTVTKEARDLVVAHGAEAYPFTEERLKEIEAKYDDMAKEWPKKVKHVLHEEHELELTRVQVYTCDKCEEEGTIWSYHCDECDFDLHAKCALKEETKANGDEAVKEGGSESTDGWVCDGNVCTKA
ncbi:Thioredoxin domain [Arabidopsis thaliana x Arabidopsis arenosa]|uniref:protein-disulfide reductase n=1 Tax=Arabidopsis thaliana x Arabidopsis arenosa TaxID=1240361 RepID=A0A8T2BCW4_9BRAS|nr:Thioredoxin domain [Arabidopsis thaliana x Arabidopsis arenosa]